MRQVVLDTETTGLSWQQGHRIIEIGCVELIDRNITGNDYHVYINPGRKVDEGAMAVHGLSDLFLSDKSVFSSVVDDFLSYVKGSELLIHNAAFDVGFLNYELSLLKRKVSKLSDYCTISDTLLMAREKHVGARNSLDALCKRYEVDSSERELHGALLDASLLAKVYLAMTGGQCALFAVDDEESVAGANMHSAGEVVQGNWRVPVSGLSAQENAAHLAYLETMRTSGDELCLWDDEAPAS
jgi:DNA polymerase III subunit epsilon